MSEPTRLVPSTGRHADRRVPQREPGGSAAAAHPRHDRGSHDVPDGRADARDDVRRLRHGPSRPGRLGRHAPLLDRARVRGRRRGRRRAGRRIVGHPWTSSVTRTAGGRALGAALVSNAIGRVVCYEGAPAPPGASYHPPGIEDRLRERLDAGDRDGALAMFMAEVVGMSDDGAGGVPGESGVAGAGRGRRDDPAGAGGGTGPGRFAGGRSAASDSRSSRSSGRPACPVFHDATYALDARLGDGRGSS